MVGLTCPLRRLSSSEEAASLVANLVLRSEPAHLHKKLRESSIQWTPELVDSVLKRLWNHGPRALQLFRYLDLHSTYCHSPSSFDHAIDIAARLRHYKTVWALVARMRSLRLGPSPKTFSIISERYISAGNPDKALKVFLSMHLHGCPQDLRSLNTLLHLLCSSSHVPMAYSLLRSFRPDSVSYNIIAHGWCLLKQTPKALHVLREMVDRGIHPTPTTYNIMLNGYFRAAQTHEAWLFFLEMKRRSCHLDVVTYTTLIHGFGLAGDIKRARNLFAQMPRAGVLPSIPTYNALIQVLCKKDSVDNAFQVFDEMVTKGYLPNSTTYTVLIRGLCHAGRMDEALDLMERMHIHGCHPTVQTYNVLVRFFSELGEVDKGLELFRKMNDGACLPNLDTYNILISAMFLRKKPQDLLVAGRLLIEMVDRGFMPRKFTFNRVLNGLLLTGNQEFAKDILRLQSKFGRLLRQFKLS